MADPVIQQTNVWLGGYDLSGELNRIALRAKRADLGNSRMTDEMMVSHPGIQLVDAALDGFWSAGSGSPDALTNARIVTKEAAEWPLTFLPTTDVGAAAADGNLAYNVRSAQFGFRFGAEHGGLLPFYVSNRARTGKLDRGTVMLAKASRAATTTGTARQLGAVGATEQLVAILHVFSVTGGTWTLTVESDNGAGFGTPAVQATFTGVTSAPARQVITVAGPITDDYWRCVLTKSGGTSCVAAAVLAINTAA